MITNNPIMDFRLVYLRLIAMSWKDENDKDYISPMKLVESRDVISDFLVKEPFNFNPIWKYIQLRIVIDSDNKTVWKPVQTAGWIGPNDRFIINIPATPKKEDQQTEALAAYYQLFPTFLGPEQNAPVPDCNAALPTKLGVDSGPFLEFGGVTLRAIALVWEDSSFADGLISSSQEDSTPILSKYFGFNNPWNFNIEFRYDPNFFWDGTQWNNVPSNIIELNYPQKPEDAVTRATALTSYNNTGPAYPFTCG